MRLHRRPYSIAIYFVSQELPTCRQGTRCCMPVTWIRPCRSVLQHRCHCTLALWIQTCPTARPRTTHRIRGPSSHPAQIAPQGTPQCKQASWRPRCPSARDYMVRHIWQCASHLFQSAQHGTVPCNQMCWPLHHHISQLGTSHRKRTRTCLQNPIAQADKLPCTRAGLSRHFRNDRPHTPRSTG